jgi:wobble nucleotide-excising tRNase
MIKKFIKIKNIGKFKNYCAIDDISLEKATIIYGENSSGKTTLASIIRSLSINDINIIEKRKTLGCSEEVNCEILIEKNNRDINSRIKKEGWTENLENIKIFDSFFVDQNVYTGLEISSQHQKRLFQFAIGEESIEIVNTIERLKKASAKLHSKLNNIENELRIVVENYWDVKTFIDFQKDEEIDLKIKKLKKEIELAENQEIKEKQQLTELSLINLKIELDELKELLQTSLENLSQQYLQKVRAHIADLSHIMKNKAESWLREGLNYVEKSEQNRCPFCQQDLENVSSLMESYRQYFNREYKNLINRVKAYKDQLDNISISDLLNDIQTKVLENQILIEFWKKYIPNLSLPQTNIENLFKNTKEHFENIKKIINQKLENALEPVNIEEIDRFNEILKEINSGIRTYNSELKKWNEQISALKSKRFDLPNLKKELKKLEIKKKRFESEINKKCELYKKISKKIDEIKKKIDQKKEKLNQVVSEKVCMYGEEINKILDKFGVPFKIYKPSPTYRGRSREPYLEYNINLSGTKVDYEKAKYVLSDGDRNSLALAFFLAKVKLSQNIKDLILILDDPVSSLDRNRRRTTVEEIRNLSQKVKQIIVLTHYETFAYELYEYLKKIKLTPKTLMIKNGCIRKWNIEEEIKQPYFKKLDKLERFLSMEEISETEARKLIREVLEARLKFGYYKFLKDLGDRCTLGPMINRLKEVVQANKESKEKIKLFKYPNDDQVIQELSDLESFSSEEHHEMVEKRTDEVSPKEVKNYVRRTLKVIYEWL